MTSPSPYFSFNSEEASFGWVTSLGYKSWSWPPLPTVRQNWNSWNNSFSWALRDYYEIIWFLKEETWLLKGRFVWGDRLVSMQLNWRKTLFCICGNRQSTPETIVNRLATVHFHSQKKKNWAEIMGFRDTLSIPWFSTQRLRGDSWQFHNQSAFRVLYMYFSSFFAVQDLPKSK